MEYLRNKRSPTAPQLTSPSETSNPAGPTLSFGGVRSHPAAEPRVLKLLGEIEREAVESRLSDGRAGVSGERGTATGNTPDGATVAEDSNELVRKFLNLSELVVFRQAGIPGLFRPAARASGAPRLLGSLQWEVESIRRWLRAYFYVRKADWLYSFTGAPIGEAGEVRDRALHHEMLQRIFTIFPLLPVDPERAALFVLQIGYWSDYARAPNTYNEEGRAIRHYGGMVYKDWFLHPQSIGYLLSGLLEFVVNPNNLNLEALDAVSDPVARVADIRHLRYLRVLPMEKFMREQTRNLEGRIASGELLPEPLFEEVVFNYGGFRDLMDVGGHTGNFSDRVLEEYTHHPSRTALMYLKNTIGLVVRRELVAAQRRIAQPQSELLIHTQAASAPSDDTDAEHPRRRGRGGRRDRHNGAFFPFFNLLDIDLTRYQIARSRGDLESHKDVYQKNCAMFALEQSGLFTDNEVHQMSLLCNKRLIPMRKLEEICAAFNFNIELRKFTSQSGSHKSHVYTVGPKEATRHVSLGLVKQHVFLNDKHVPITSYYLSNYKRIDSWYRENMPEECYADRTKVRQLNESERRVVLANNDEARYLSSFDLVRKLVESYEAGATDVLAPVMLADIISLDMALYQEIDNKDDRAYLGSLDYHEGLNLKSFASCGAYAPSAISTGAKHSTQEICGLSSKTPIKGVRLFYADFEAFTVSDDRRPLNKHVPFMCCVAIDDPTDEEVYVFNGEACGRELLEFINAKMAVKYFAEAPVVYFHNLGYDINFLAKYGISTAMPRGRRMLNTEITYEGRVITFKDSASLIPMPLKAFGPMFGLDVEKEIFPYEFYTEKRYYERDAIPVTEVLDFMGSEWESSTRIHFVHNVRMIQEEPDTARDDLKVDLHRYAAYYCRKDVEVLKKGLNAFREGIRSDFGLEATNYLSVSSVADAIFQKEVYFKTKDLYKVGGIVREFMQRAIHGGRVMCADNQKWTYRADVDDIKAGEGIVDFDAVSLYPSAMARLWVVSGKPQVFTSEQLHGGSFVTDPHYTAYVVDIRITKINKPRHFPLVIGRDPATGSVLNTNEAPVEMTVCDIELEDLIKFQEVEFEALRGYYWTGPKSYAIQECIRRIFNKRLEYKAQHNPLEGIYKLIMNSIYGKTILKPAYTKLDYYRKSDPAFQNMVYRHSAEIDYISEIDDSDIIAVKRSKPILKHFNFSLFGIHILAMSKRIMNEVMCLAEDLGMTIYYQDTDSMHIERRNLNRLALQYKEVYGRELIGRQLGQFHSDFDQLRPESTNVRAVESYFIGKKCYLDKLVDDQGNTGYHIRLKGVPKDAILEYAWEHFNGDVTAIYKLLAAGHSLKFNLLARHNVRFDYTRSMTVRTKEVFERNVSFKTTLPPDNFENGAFWYRDEEGEVYDDPIGPLLRKLSEE